MKNLDHYLGLNYRKSVYQDEENDYIIEVPDLPGCMADGRTPDEAFENIRAAMSSWISSRIAAGLEIPEPKNTEGYSGKMLLRMASFLHRRLAEQAENEGISLNQYIVSLLSDASARVDTFAMLTEANAQIAEMVEEVRRERRAARYVTERLAVVNVPEKVRWQGGIFNLALPVRPNVCSSHARYMPSGQSDLVRQLVSPKQSITNADIVLKEELA
jgi:antitoxin HicB